LLLQSSKKAKAVHPSTLRMLYAVKGGQEIARRKEN